MLARALRQSHLHRYDMAEAVLCIEAVMKG